MGWGFFFRAGSDNMDILIYIHVYVGFSLEQAMNTLTNMKATIKWIHEFDTEVVWILFPGNVSKRLNIYTCCLTSANNTSNYNNQIFVTINHFIHQGGMLNLFIFFYDQ